MAVRRDLRTAGPFPIVVGLGCNQGPRRQSLEWALILLGRAGVTIAGRSRLYWTRPWGVTDQPDFLNAAVAVRTALGPLALLDRCLWVEHCLGRRRDVRWGPRRIDLDVLLYGNVRTSHPRLTIPHPWLARRDFVLAPLADLAVPPPVGLAPRGWRARIDSIPPTDRTILHVEDWR